MALRPIKPGEDGLIDNDQNQANYQAAMAHMKANPTAWNPPVAPLDTVEKQILATLQEQKEIMDMEVATDPTFADPIEATPAPTPEPDPTPKGGKAKAK
jgi:hypothetical protein